MNNLLVLASFALAAAVTWYAGIWLARTVDAIDARFNLGGAFGGLLLLGIATSLPEIAIVVTAALQHQYSIIIGTLIGGIALQTVIICLLDVRSNLDRPLTFAAASLSLVLEGGIVALMVALSLVASKTPLVVPHTSLSLSSLLIFGVWLLGLWLVYNARKSLPWKSEAIAATPGRAHHERRKVVNHKPFEHASNARIFGLLAAASAVTLAAGYVLATTGVQIAAMWGIGAGFFAATFIALTGSLPNISTGLSSVAIGDYQLAISDVFGGNAFMPALFLVCDLVSGHAVLTEATRNDIWFAALGITLTIIYLLSLIVRPRHQYFRMGVDSIAVLALYIVGVTAIFIAG
jgi:cation:H+ antiporter